MALAQGKGHGVEVRPVSPALQEAVPGSILSLSFLVTNDSGREEEFIESLDLPKGWQAVVPCGSFEVPASEAVSRLVALQVPRGGSAGRYEIAYSVQSRRDPTIRDVASVEIVVQPVLKLTLVVEEKPEAAVAGTAYAISLRLANESNVELRVALEVRSREKYPAEIDPREATLAPRESALVTVTVQTDRDERKPHVHHVQVKALGTSADQEEATVGATVGVEIVPIVSGEADAYHRLPAELTLRLAGEGARSDLQVEGRGKGTLNEEGTRGVEFLLRGPDTGGSGSFGLRDEYWFRYFTDDLRIQLGDQSYGLSRLTSHYRYGRGVGVDYSRPGAATGLGAYYLEGRWTSSERKEGGVYVSHRVNEDWSVRLNVLQSNTEGGETESPTVRGLWSLETEIMPRDDMKIQAEYAQCYNTGQGDGTEDTAYRVEWDGRFGDGGYYRLARSHAGPDYYGSYHDSEYSYASLSYPLSTRLRAQVSYNGYARNLASRPDSQGAPREDLWQASATYSLSGGWYASLGYSTFHRYDRLVPALFDYDERAWRVRVGRSTGKYSLGLEARMGDQDDRLTGDTRPAANYNGTITYRPDREAHFSFYGGFGSNELLRSSRLLRESNNIGASVAWQARPDLRLDFWYTKYNYESVDRAGSDQYSLRIAHGLPDSNRLVFEARHNTRELWGRGTSYRLAYTIPLSVRVSRKKSVGLVRGRVYDAEAPDHVGVAGAILRMGSATAVTNEKGEFVFPSVAPGTHEILMGRNWFTLDQVPDQRLPLVVEVSGGETTRVEIGMVSAATVMGTVLVIPADGATGETSGSAGGGARGVVGGPGARAAVGPEGLANVLVELTNGDEVLRRLTDQKGRFLFEHVRPGPWRLKVYDHNLPEYHYVETPERDLALTPGQSVEVTVRVLPKVRQIKFIDEGSIGPGGD